MSSESYLTMRQSMSNVCHAEQGEDSREGENQSKSPQRTEPDSFEWFLVAH
ncbi:hypothetical protein N9079_03955 [bacterium]|nr:hypothetical protein [bacterium]